MSESPEPRHRPSELVAVLYAELRRLAEAQMRRERAHHTLRPTELVHEAYLRLKEDPTLRLNSRAHFLGIASKVMRRVLIDHARRRNARKRDGQLERVTLDEALGVPAQAPLDILVLDKLLDRLAQEDPDAGHVAELRIFGGLSEKETAEQCEMSLRWVQGQWAYARAWLTREIEG